jgi:hypothetical protein
VGRLQVGVTVTGFNTEGQPSEVEDPEIMVVKDTGT